MKKIIFKNIIPLIAVPIFGFVLLNITFLFYAIFQGSLRRLIMIFIDFSQETNLFWIPAAMRLLFVIVILIISFFVLRTKMKPILKAIFLTAPTATILVIIGIFFYQQPVIVYILGFLFVFSVLYYFYKTKQPRLYYYSVILVSLFLAI